MICGKVTASYDQLVTGGMSAPNNTEPSVDGQVGREPLIRYVAST